MSALDFPTSPNDGDTYEGYVYNATKGVWQWQTLTPSLVSLTDTDITTPANGEVLEYDGTNWVNAAVAAGGKILQVVRATNATNQSTSSASFTDTGASITITPQSSTSTLQIYAYFNASAQGAANTSHQSFLQITDSADTALSGAEALQLFGYTSSQNTVFPVAMLGVVAAGSTSAQTFKLRFKVGFSGSAFLPNATQTLQMIALEVAG